MDSLKKMMETYHDKVFSLYAKGSELGVKSYSRGVADGIDNFVPAAFMAGADGLRKLVIAKPSKGVDTLPDESVVVGLSKSMRSSVIMKVTNGKMLSYDGKLWNCDEFDYLLILEALFGKEVPCQW